MKLCARKEGQRPDIFFIIPWGDNFLLSPDMIYMREISKLLDIMQVQGILKAWGTEAQLPSGRPIK